MFFLRASNSSPGVRDHWFLNLLKLSDETFSFQSQILFFYLVKIFSRQALKYQ